ncbi:hypothetical protein P879_01351 [Paragonimus westermani]|uniref:Prefoldin subunit 1 n=1 Tax=Paragonimus westermani TaxID=34504 RepID=A0A8T0DXP6_9TREM|nr:hypothetical protein P879_01351 [Paragonimus westermani]
MSKDVDIDVKKAIESHRQQTIAANHQISLLNAQLDGLSMKHRRSELVEQELKSLQSDVVTYKAVGRMFIKKGVPLLIDDIVNERSVICTNIETLKKNRDTVSNNLVESKDALRELLSTKQIS